MNFASFIDARILPQLTDATVIGIDIGSRTAKAVLFSAGTMYTASTATGINMQATADELIAELVETSELKRSDIDYIVGTGYGRVAMKFPDIPHQIVTEISCHAMGNHVLDADIQTIVDIGGQDSKAIKVDPKTGKVVEFIMNDKCAAGTGRFLERVAGILDFDIDELGDASTKAKNPVDISSQCVVFAESEVISLRAKGADRADIAAGIHLAAALRIRNLLKRIGLIPGISFSGGVSNNEGMRKAIEDLLGHSLARFKVNPIFAGAIGAAVHAQKYHASGYNNEHGDPANFVLDLEPLKNLVEKQKESLITNALKQKKVGYLCTYTPQELVYAAGVAPVRLFKRGSSEEVASGEQITQSVFCDFTKSVLGAFKEGDPLYTSLDKVYTFYTCDCIKKVGEAIGQFFTKSEIYNLPRLKEIQSSRDYYKSEIVNFKNDLEKLSGNKIEEQELWRQIKTFNHARRLLKQISELRKRGNPPVTGQNFLDLISGFYHLPADELVEQYQGIYDRLKAVPETGKRRIRLMMSGGIIADGDRKLLELIEDTIGARIVVEDHCTGLKNVNHELAETGDPYQSLADGYLDQAPCARMKPLQDRIDESVRLAKDYNVDGILYVYLKFCPCYGQVKHEFFKQYQALGIPVLELPIDYSASDQGQIKTRLEAFIEVLKERKDTAATLIQS